jgi:hypothetical protein
MYVLCMQLHHKLWDGAGVPQGGESVGRKTQRSCHEALAVSYSRVIREAA